MNGDQLDPLAQAGAAMKEGDRSQSSDSDATTPTDTNSSKPSAFSTLGGAEVVPKEQRLGQINKVEQRLPHVHAEPNEYYGGNQVWSRARTFSNVSFCGLQLVGSVLNS